MLFFLPSIDNRKHCNATDVADFYVLCKCCISKYSRVSYCEGMCKYPGHALHKFANSERYCPCKYVKLRNDYILGSLYVVHVNNIDFTDFPQIPEIINCSKFEFLPAIFQHVQVMRFAVEEINNSSTLLPNVKLGYEIFDYCSDTQNIKSVLDFLSLKGSVPVKKSGLYEPKVISVTGPFGSTQSITVAPLFMSNLIPMVTHGATSVQLSNKLRFPSFFRTVPSDKYQVKAIVHLLQEFGWNWVAFIGGDNDYSRDAHKEFTEEIRSANICLAYQATIPNDISKIPNIFEKLSNLNISVVIVFANQEFAVPFIEKVIEENVQKMWIASETWSLSQELMTKKGIDTVGTVLGITIGGTKTLQGFEEFVSQSVARERRTSCSNESLVGVKDACNQECSECLTADPKKIFREDPTYIFAIYSAVYAVAHALHAILRCGPKGCNHSEPVYPYMVTEALKNVKFDLFNQSVEFDKNGDPPAHYDIVYWDWNSHSHVTIGAYHTGRTVSFDINKTYIHWKRRRMVPELKCSSECKKGYKRVRTGYHTCCFNCLMCTEGAYVNYTADPYNCSECEKDEWSSNGSTLCQKRSLVYLRHKEPLSIGLLFSASFILVSSVAVMALFACKYNTPVVRSAGGSMCFFMLGCLCLSSVSVFFYVGRPGYVHCVLRNPAFAVFYTGCMSCLAIRSFQIVCIFKMASKLPKAYDYWVKHNGQWVAIASAVVIQLFLCGLWMGIDGPRPINHTVAMEITLDCSLGNAYIFNTILIFLGLLSVACFIFAYMGTDLPKNYNEGKSITFCLLIFYISWTMYLTVYLSLKGKYPTAVNAVSVLCTLLGILLGYFFPKCYIIIFKPDRNTATFFQTAIQSYTIQSST